MIKNQWLKLTLYSLIGILGLGLLQWISRLFSSPTGHIGGRMGSSMSGGMMISGVGPGMMSGIGVGIVNFILSTLMILLVVTLFIGIIGFIYSYVKQNVLIPSQPQIIASNQLPNTNEAISEEHPEVQEKNAVQIKDQVKEIVVTAHNMTFEPKVIKVDKGTKVKLTFKNEEEVVNDFVIEGINVKTEKLGPKTEQTIEFIAERQGEFNTRSTVSTVKNRSGKFIVQ